VIYSKKALDGIGYAEMDEDVQECVNKGRESEATIEEVVEKWWHTAETEQELHYVIMAVGRAAKQRKTGVARQQ